VSRADNEALLKSLAGAIENDRLRMMYQPQVSLSDGSLVAVEALVRWDHPELGPVSPALFVPLAEQHGLIHDLTEWGLRAILRQSAEWRDQGMDVQVAFNISALSLKSLDFPDLVERMCRDLGVSTDRIILELTEGATQPLIKLMDTLTRFRIKGIGLAIDDFGTGYSSLMLLRKLPFTELKIDREFVRDVHLSRDSRLIIESMTSLARGLGLESCAEGVETAEQLKVLREIGCDRAQGFLVAPGLRPEDLSAWRERFAAAWPGLAGS
jgi:EAL domain-containing protein (putative c-di-GMP-specific phosphodiesterase class I)